MNKKIRITLFLLGLFLTACFNSEKQKNENVVANAEDNKSNKEQAKMTTEPNQSVAEEESISMEQSVETDPTNQEEKSAKAGEATVTDQSIEAKEAKEAETATTTDQSVQKNHKTDKNE